MTQTNLRLTIIHSQKLKNIVGLGGSSPYQIWVEPGDSLGVIGSVMDPATTQSATNDDSMPEPLVYLSWMRRTLLTLGLKRS